MTFPPRSPRGVFAVCAVVCLVLTGVIPTRAGVSSSFLDSREKFDRSLGHSPNNLINTINAGASSFEFFGAASANRGERFASANTTSHAPILTAPIGNFVYIGGSGDLSDPTKYLNGQAPGNGQDITFSNLNGGSVSNSGIASHSPLNSINSFTFDNISGAFTLSGNALAVNAGVTNNSGSLETVNNNLSLSADQSFNASGGSLAFGGSLNTNGKTLTLAGNSSLTFTGVVTGAGNLLKTGNGLAFLSGSYSGNGHLGSTTVDGGTLKAGVGSLIQTSTIEVNNGGTLLLSGSGRHIGANTSVTLTGGTFDTGGFSEPSGVASGAAVDAIGALTLSSTSTISFGAGSSSILQFSGVSHVRGSSMLQITNWDGVPDSGGSGDRLLFSGIATAPNGFFLQFGQNDVSFNGVNGYAFVQFDPLGPDPYYEITSLAPIPEPSTWAASALVALALGFYQHRRIRTSSKKPR